MRIIEFYKTEFGNSPIEDFFDSLNSKQMQKTAWVLKLIKELEIIPSQYFKKLEDTDELWEIRIRFASVSIRILCFLEGDNIIVLIGGFIKKTNKTPKDEINKAEKRKNDYIRRLKK